MLEQAGPLRTEPHEGDLEWSINEKLQSVGRTCIVQVSCVRAPILEQGRA